MIENLKGMHEFVNYKENTTVRLYDNTETDYYPVHWHGPIEIIMPINSTYEVMCANNKYVLEPDDVVIIAPGIVHSVGTNCDGKRIIFQIEPGALRQIKGLDFLLTHISPAIHLDKNFDKEAHSKIKQYILDIKDEYLSTDPNSEIFIYSRFLEIMALVGQHSNGPTINYKLDSSKSRQVAEKIQYACNYISEHCTEEISLESVANMAGFSKFHFSRQFKKYTNTSFYHYLTEQRIYVAERLLVESELSITEISYQCGFSNASTFNRMFKLINECTPKDFKKQYAKG